MFAPSAAPVLAACARLREGEGRLGRH